MILVGDCLSLLRAQADESVQCCVTSPPYWGLRSYLADGHASKGHEIGLERTPEEWLAKIVAVFEEVRRVLHKAGTLWLNLGDCYDAGTSVARMTTTAGKHGYWANPAISRRATWDRTKPKDLIGLPWMVAFALRAAGWYLRQDIIWHKPNPMPESTTDRCTKAHEYLFLLSRSRRYHFDYRALEEPAGGNTHARASKTEIERITTARSAGANTAVGKGPTKKRHAFDGRVRANDSYQNAMCLVTRTRRKRDVWTIPTAAFAEAHFATFPEALVEPCILAGCPERGLVLDPFAGTGTVGAVCARLGRKFLGMELNPEYAKMAERRIHKAEHLFTV